MASIKYHCLEWQKRSILGQSKVLVIVVAGKIKRASKMVRSFDSIWGIAPI